MQCIWYRIHAFLIPLEGQLQTSQPRRLRKSVWGRLGSALFRPCKVFSRLEAVLERCDIWCCVWDGFGKLLGGMFIDFQPKKGRFGWHWMLSEKHAQLKEHCNNSIVVDFYWLKFAAYNKHKGIMNIIKVTTRVAETKASTALAYQTIQKPIGLRQQKLTPLSQDLASASPTCRNTNEWVFDPSYGESSIGVLV